MFNIRLADMIENEDNVRTLTHHFNRICHLDMGNTDSKAELIIDIIIINIYNYNDYRGYIIDLFVKIFI